MINEEKIVEILTDCRAIAITGHINPDGDSVGSCLAFGMWLKKIGKEPKVILGEYSKKYDIIPGAELIYKGDIDAIEADTLLILDCSAKSRLGVAKKLFDKAQTTICVDHHLNVGGFAQYDLIDENASSTCELVFKIINKSLDKDIASALYAGMIFDTGGFRHSSTSPETLHIAATLIGMGIPFSEIYNEIMYMHSLSEAKILALIIDRLEIIDGVLSYSYIRIDDLKRLESSNKDLSGIVEYILNVRNVEVAMFIYEVSENEVKVSLRSKGINVGEIASGFGGGGHKLAAGCNFTGSVEDAASDVMFSIKEVLRDRQSTRPEGEN